MFIGLISVSPRRCRNARESQALLLIIAATALLRAR
jgi:hypothetical protein